MLRLLADCRRSKIQTSRKVKALGLGLFSLSLVLLLSGCRGVASPQGWSSPVFSGSSVVVSPNHTTLVDADLSTNSRAWTFPPSKSNISLTAIYGTPALSQNLVLLGGYNGTLYALHQSDGSEVWNQLTGGHIVGAPVASDSTVYVGSTDRCLYAFNVTNGNQVFSPFCTGEKLWSTPAVANRVVYFGSLELLREGGSSFDGSRRQRHRLCRQSRRKYVRSGCLHGERALALQGERLDLE
jgi:outer membrane protein assembly factor BamB